MGIRDVYLMGVLLLKDAVLSLKAIRKDTLYLVSPTRSGFMIQVMGDSNRVGLQHPFVQALRYPNKNRGHLNCTGLLMIDCGDDKNTRV